MARRDIASSAEYSFRRELIILRLARLLPALFALCLSHILTAQAESVTVAAASNFKTALDALADEFEAATEHDVQLVFGSTGKLYAQIRFGAPYDLFLAADQARPERLEEEGMIVPNSRFTYAEGRLVLWSSKPERISEQHLGSPKLNRLAMANPELAPYGLAARQVLQALDLDQQLKQKIVYGESVGQAFAFVRTGNAQLGLVSYAQVLSLPRSQRGYPWMPPPDLHAPIRQDAVLLTRGSNNPAAEAFHSFLQSAKARDIIAQHGYDLP